jgi:hypothetical protein
LIVLFVIVSILPIRTNAATTTAICAPMFSR